MKLFLSLSLLLTVATAVPWTCVSKNTQTPSKWDRYAEEFGEACRNSMLDTLPYVLQSEKNWAAYVSWYNITYAPKGGGCITFPSYTEELEQFLEKHPSKKLKAQVEMIMQ